MRARILLTALLALPLVAGAARGQSYTVKTKDFPATGKSTTVTDVATTRSSVTIATGGNVLKEEKKGEVEEKQFTETVVEAGDKKPNKYTQSFTKAFKGKEGEPAKQSYAGKTIVFERKGDVYEVTAEGGGVDAKDLDEFAKKANQPKIGQAMYPKSAVKVGESWTIGKEALLLLGASLDDGLDLTKMKAQGKLLKAYQKAGQQWGTIEVTITAPVQKLGPLALETPIDFQVKATLDTAIDGSSTAGQMKASISFKGRSEFTQNGMTFTLDIAIAGEYRSEHSAEK
jgi:hypothetical protein